MKDHRGASEFQLALAHLTSCPTMPDFRLCGPTIIPITPPDVGATAFGKPLHQRPSVVTPWQLDTPSWPDFTVGSDFSTFSKV